MKKFFVYDMTFIVVFAVRLFLRGVVDQRWAVFMRAVIASARIIDLLGYLARLSIPLNQSRSSMPVSMQASVLVICHPADAATFSKKVFCGPIVPVLLPVDIVVLRVHFCRTWVSAYYSWPLGRIAVKLPVGAIFFSYDNFRPSIDVVN